MLRISNIRSHARYPVRQGKRDQSIYHLNWGPPEIKQTPLIRSLVKELVLFIVGAKTLHGNTLEGVNIKQERIGQVSLHLPGLYALKSVLWLFLLLHLGAYAAFPHPPYDLNFKSQSSFSPSLSLFLPLSFTYIHSFCSSSLSPLTHCLLWKSGYLFQFSSGYWLHYNHLSPGLLTHVSDPWSVRLIISTYQGDYIHI